ncbi:MAG: hypothetical protein M3065_19925 [Actinomycetota bacterium]|nr:hypothetical protein [Actinomycetota bacterium]
MFAIIEWAGAVGVLAAFALSQAGTWPTAGYRYQAVNLVSGVGLTVAGVASGQWGFVTLNGAWALIAAYGLLAHRDALPPGNLLTGRD